MSYSEVRPTLEAFKFLPFSDVIQRAALVCRSWGKVASHDELWIGLARQQGVEPFTANCSVKRALRQYLALQSALAVVEALLALRFTVECALKSSAHTDAGSSCVFLFDGSVLCTGGGGVKTTSSSAYRLTLAGEVTELQRMQLPRSEHGIVLFLDTVFVFGGWSVCRTLADTEKLQLRGWDSLSVAPWKPIASMLSARMYFNPCLHHSLVYICGGGTDLCETFNPSVELFRPISWKLPNQYSHHSAFADSSAVCVLSDLWLSRFGSGVAEKVGLANKDTWGNMRGVLVHSLFYLPFGNAVRVFSLAKSGCRKILAVEGIALQIN